MCPLGERLPPAQRAIRLWGVTVWGEMGAHSAPFPRMSWGAAVGGVPSPLPTGSRCPRSDAGKGYPSASPHTPYPDPRPVLSSRGGRAAGLLNGRHRLPTRSRAVLAVPAQSRSQARCEGEAGPRRMSERGWGGAAWIPGPGVWGRGRRGAPLGHSSLVSASPWWSKAWTSCGGTRG